MAIIFKKTRDTSNQFDNTDIEITSHSITMSDIIEDFKSFLMACGYPIDFTDKLEITNDDE